MKFLKIILIYCSILAVFVSCEKDEVENNYNDTLIPFQVGNKWIYKNTYSSKIDTIEHLISEKKKIGDFIGYKYKTADRPFNVQYFISSNKDGDIVEIGGFSDTDTLIVNSICYKFDVKKGDSWKYRSVISSYDTGKFEERTTTVKCIATDTLITTPKGDFKCKAYVDSPNGGDDIFYTYISDGIGIIKMEHYESDELNMYRELIDYKLK